MTDYALLMNNGSVFELDELRELEKYSSLTHDDFMKVVHDITVAKLYTYKQCVGFLADLREVLYGDSTIKNNGIVSISHIADIMHINLKDATLWYNSILAWHLSELQGGGLVV